MIHISRPQRLLAVIGIATCFFLAEISVGFYTHSIALVADAFHYLNDLVGFIVAYVALRVSESEDSPKALSFGWQRAQLLGAFFNGVLLFALGISIFLQSIERFVALQYVENPKMVFIMGCIGLCLNIISATFLHEHHHGHDHGHSHGHSHEIPGEVITLESDENCLRHHNHKHSHLAAPPSHGHDLGMMGVLLHVIGDAANNLGVMAAALVMWLADYGGRYYADPGTSMGIAMMIILSSLPLMRRAGLILLESAPNGVDLEDVKHDLEKIPGVLAIHELHIWSLDQRKTLASVHFVVSEHTMPGFLDIAKIMNECFHAYGIHSATLQPEIASAADMAVLEKKQANVEVESLQKRSLEKCKVVCGTLCEELKCCS